MERSIATTIRATIPSQRLVDCKNGPPSERKSSAEVFFAKQRESLAKQNLSCEVAVVDRERDAWLARGAKQHWVHEANVQLGTEQVETQFRQ